MKKPDASHLRNRPKAHFQPGFFLALALDFLIGFCCFGGFWLWAIWAFSYQPNLLNALLGLVLSIISGICVATSRKGGFGFLLGALPEFFSQALWHFFH